MRLLLLSLLLAASSASAQTGTISGTVLEADGVTGVIGANVRVGGTTLGAATDLDGNYRIIGIPVGTYPVTAYYAGYLPTSVNDVTIEAGTTRTLTFTRAEGDVTDIGFCFYCDGPPLITNDAVGQSRILRGRDLENMAVPR